MSQLPPKTHSESDGIAPARRSFLLGAAASGTALMAGGGLTRVAQATTHTHSGLLSAAEGCVSKGHTCLNHCIGAFKAGDTSLVDCAVSVQEVIAACAALSHLSASKSTHTKAFANACAAVCEDCEKECRKHTDKHPACADCAEACLALVSEAKKAA